MRHRQQWHQRHQRKWTGRTFARWPDLRDVEASLHLSSPTWLVAGVALSLLVAALAIHVDGGGRWRRAETASRLGPGHALQGGIDPLAAFALEEREVAGVRAWSSPLEPGEELLGRAK